MFTGIIESIGEIKSLKKVGGNIHFEIKSSLTAELKIDQSLAHNGVCLTVVEIAEDTYIVTAISETLSRTNLKDLKKGDSINIERAMKLGDRLDGHIVQGHVDQTGICKNIHESNGSWIVTIQYSPKYQNITIEKGSITINGVSLTVVTSRRDEFSVAVIPYTYNHTNFKHLKEGDAVNLEFDVIGKYVSRITQGYS